MVACVPTLSTNGWVTSPVEKFDNAFADFMSSNYSQSKEFYSTISSLPYVIQQCTGDPVRLESLAKTTLVNHLTGLFEDLTVSTVVRDHPTEAGKMQLIFYVAATESGTPFNFARAIKDIDSKTLELFDINNG